MAQETEPSRAFSGPLNSRSCLAKALTQLLCTGRLAPMYTLPQKPLLFLLPFSLAHRLTTSSSTGVTKGDGPRKAQDTPLPHSGHPL